MSRQQTYQPFPGLRAYGLQDSKYYSGREAQKHQLLKIIGERNFVAVVGGNGVGKTSFVNSLIIPELLQGFVAKGKSNWKVVAFCPGKNPLSALATALSRVDVIKASNDDKIDPNLSDRFETILKSTNYGILEIVEQHKLAEKDNLLIFIDHLDDLLFFADNKSESSKREIKAFINRLVEVVNQSAYSITVITTLRTEVAGHFSMFPELAEILNKHQFLLGALKPKDLLPIFEKITKEGVISFDPALLKHIQNFYKSNPLVLGEFQHALKQSIEQWQLKGSQGSVSLDHLNEVGGLNETISYQLDNIYGYLSSFDKQTCKLMFQALTETSALDTTFSTPRTILDISEITARTPDEIIKVAKLFTDEKCGVIIKYDPQDITGRLEYLDHAMERSDNLITEHSEITVAQDFLIEQWPRLNKWIKEEFLNSNVYRDIAKDAERNDPPYEGEKLAATWKWYESLQPHEGWGKQYYTNFSLVEEFILKSKARADRERDRRESEELSRQQKSRRNRTIKVIFSLVAFVLTVFAFIKTREASVEAKKANEQQQIAAVAESQAQKAKEEAAYEKRTAELSILQASRDRELAQMALDSAEDATERARKAKEEAIEAQRRAQNLRAEADKLSRTVQSKNKELSKAEIKIEESKINEEFFGILEAVREYSDEAIRILNRSNNVQQQQEAAKIATKGYLEFLKVNEERFAQIKDTTKDNTQKKLFSAITLAYQKVGGSKQLSQIIYGIAMNKKPNTSQKGGSGEFIIGTNDANSTIYKVVIENGVASKPNEFTTARNPDKKIMGIKDLCYANSAKHFIVSHLPIDQTTRHISKYDASGNLLSSIDMPALIESIHPYGENNFIVVDQNGNVFLIDATDIELKSTKFFDLQSQLRAVDFNKTNAQLYLGLPNRKVMVLAIENGAAKQMETFELNDFDSEISALKYINSKKWLLIGTRTGELYLYDMTTKKRIYQSLNEHTGYINCLVVSDKEKVLITGGRDKIINIWYLDQLVNYIDGGSNERDQYQPIEFDEGESIRDVAFLDENWILVVYSTEGLTSGKGGASLLPLDFDITGKELQKLVK